MFMILLILLVSRIIYLLFTCYSLKGRMINKSFLFVVDIVNEIGLHFIALFFIFKLEKNVTSIEDFFVLKVSSWIK